MYRVYALLFLVFAMVMTIQRSFSYQCTLRGLYRLQNTQIFSPSSFYMSSNNNMGEKAKENLVKGIQKAKDAVDNDDTGELKGSAVGAIVGGTVLGPFGAIM